MSNNVAKVAIVLGATGYVGRAVVEHFDKNKIRVALLCKESSKDNVVDFISGLQGSHHKWYASNFEDEVAFSQLIKKIEGDMGPVSFAVDASGVAPARKSVTECTFLEIEEYFKKTFKVSFIFLTECAKFFKEQKNGVLVGITTAGVIKEDATKMLNSYVLSKYAIQGLLVLLKQELLTLGVSVFSVAPGFMQGGLNKHLPSTFFAMFKHVHKLEEITSANDVAEQIIELCLHKELYKNLTVSVAKECPDLH